jgi:glycosyltransferase involved in cell wall biosynthesis
MMNNKNIKSSKLSVVIVSHGVTPYGIHFLERVVNELSDFTIHTIYTYEYSNGKWQITPPNSINAVILGKGEEQNIWKKGWSRYRQLIREIKRHSPVAVMIYGYSQIPHFLVIEWCYRNKIPCMMWGDSNILGDRKKGFIARLKKPIVARVISRCSALLPCGNLGKQYFQKYGARPEQIFFVPNEPDYSLIENASPVLLQSLASEFKLIPSRRRFIFSGRFVALKRIDLLIDAFIQLADKLSGWDLLMVGGGPLEAELKARVPDKLQGRILWTGYIDTPQRASAFYKLADVLVLPSEYEAWALVVNEAVCAGLALICSNVVGAAAEMLHDYENGRFFQTGDLASLKNAMEDVANKDNLSKYKAASLKIVKNWRRTADPVEGFRQALNFSLNLKNDG